MMRLELFDYDTLNDLIVNFAPIVIDDKTAFTGAQLKYLLGQHLEKSFLNFSLGEKKSVFRDQWTNFYATYKDSYVSQYRALRLEYNPLENYNGRSEFKHGAHVDIDAMKFGKHIDIDTNTVADRHSQTGTTGDTYAFDSNQYSKDSKTITDTDVNGYEDTFEHINAEHTDTETKTYDEYTDVETKSGNLGVTTSQQMLQSELELRQWLLNKWLVDLFARENLFYC